MNRFRQLLPLAFLALAFGFSSGAAAQTDGTVVVKSFPGNDVGTKATNAMAACNPNRTIPCILQIDASLASFAPGTLPSLCSNCYYMDYRTGPPGAAGALILANTSTQTMAGPLITPQLQSDIYLNASSDICAQINGAVTALGSAGGTIYLPLSSSLSCATTATLPYSTLRLIGKGSLSTVINCTVAGDCLFINPSIGGVNINTSQAELAYFSIQGNGASGQNLIHTRDVIGWSIHDLNLDGANASGSAGLFMEDYAYWTERNRIVHVGFGYQLAKSVRLYANPADSYCPSSTPADLCSFGYNDFESIGMTPRAGQIGWSFEGNGLLYGGTITATENVAGTSISPATIFYANSYFRATYEWMDNRAEENGAGDIAWNLSSANNNFQFGGHNYTDPFANNFASSASQLTITEGGWGPDYTQTTFTPDNGVPYDFHAGNSYSIPEYSAASYLGGFGLRTRFQYSTGNWNIIGDGSNNGGSAILNNASNGTLDFYVFPRTGGTTQVIAPGSLSSFQQIHCISTGCAFNGLSTSWGSPGTIQTICHNASNFITDIGCPGGGGGSMTWPSFTGLSAYGGSNNWVTPTYSMVVALWASGSCSGLLKSDGTCAGTTRSIAFQFGQPGGSAISTGVLGYLTIPFGCTISGWSIQADAGTDTVKFLKVAAGTAIPTLGSNSISTAGVSLATGTVIQSTTLTDFTTTTVTANDIIAADLIATSGTGYISAQLGCNQ